MKGEFDEDVAVRTGCSKIFHSLHLFRLCISVLVLVYYKRKFLCQWLRDTHHYGYSRMSFQESFHCSVLFSRTIGFGFALCPRPIQPQGLSHLNNVMHGFDHAEWALSPFREWLVIPMFVLLLSQHIMWEVTMVDYRFCRWSGGYLSPLVTWGVPWPLVNGVKALVRHHFGFSVFIEICN